MLRNGEERVMINSVLGIAPSETCAQQNAAKGERTPVRRRDRLPRMLDCHQRCKLLTRRRRRRARCFVPAGHECS
eukprot:scaffold215568_cov31-Tisochrysis_lutea.AAC.1